LSHASGTMPSRLRNQMQTNRTGAPKEPEIILVRNIKGENAKILEIGRKADLDRALNPSRCATANNRAHISVESTNQAMVFMSRNRCRWDFHCGRPVTERNPPNYLYAISAVRVRLKRLVARLIPTKLQGPGSHALSRCPQVLLWFELRTFDKLKALIFQSAFHFFHC
jgi:hypothetical protein